MMRELGLSTDAAEHILYNESGRKGLSGKTNDVKELLESGEASARFALDYFALKVAQFSAHMAASLGGADAIIFTGGIGENAASIREAVLKHLSFFGPLCSLVIAANEERMIAMYTAIK